MEKEIWVKCIGFKNYEVSNLGKIRICRHPESKVKNMNLLEPLGSLIKVNPCAGGRYLAVKIFDNNFTAKRVGRMIHLLIFWSFNPDLEKKEFYEVDHIDGDIYNYRLDNLQYITHSQNIAKSFDKTKTTSKHTGVWWNKRQNVWSCMIRHNSKRYFLGNFIDEDKAGQAYSTAYSVLQSGGCIASRTCIAKYSDIVSAG